MDSSEGDQLQSIYDCRDTPISVPISEPSISQPATVAKLQELKWRFMTDAEISEFLKANGTSIAVLREHLTNAGFYTTYNNKGRITKTYRAECALNGARLRIGYIRLWTSAFVAQQREDFTWEAYVSDVLRLPKHQFQGWPELVKTLYDRLENLDLKSILNSAKAKWSMDFWKTTTDVLGRPCLQKSLLEPQRKDDQGELDLEITYDGGQATDTTSNVDQDGSMPSLAEDSKDKPGRYPVLRMFLEDMLSGLGMLRSEVEKRYVNSLTVHEISLDQKIRLIKNKITFKLSTYRGYIRTANLFLLWLNEEDPLLWKESGILLGTQHNIYAFLEDYRMGKIRPTGAEPAISQVLNGTVAFKRRTSKMPLSSANGAKLLSSLSFMYDAQQTLLNAVKVDTLRSYRSFSLWEHNLQYAETDRRHETYDDRQKNVLATECPLNAKKRQSVHLILEDSWLSARNRSLSLCQAFSISRFDELSRWTIADMHVFTYSAALPTVGEQDINVIYVQQAMHKLLKDGKIPDEKLIVRHKDLLLCPLSSLAMMLFERFVQSNERPVDLTNFQSWFHPIISVILLLHFRNNVKVFRTLSDPDKAVSSGTLYSQRKEMMENTATAASGCVNHYDRKLGALIARLHGISNSELKSLGLWEPSVLDKHYSKYALPDTVAKLSGFKDGAQYFLPRSRADPVEFQEIHGGDAMFSSFFPFLDDAAVFQSVLEQRAEGNNTCFNVYQTLHLIRWIFWQDLPHYFALYPQLRIFKCATLVDHWGMFMKWCAFCNDKIIQTESFNVYRSELSLSQNPTIDAEELTAWRNSVDLSIRELKSVSMANSAKLDRLLHAIETHGAFGKRKREDDEEFRNSLARGGKHIIRKLRDLNDMTIEEIYEEWNVAVISEGVEFCSLKELERRRTELKEQYRSEVLKTTVSRRRSLAQFIDQTAKELGSLQRAFKWIEDLQLKLGQGKKCTLHKLWQHITAF